MELSTFAYFLFIFQLSLGIVFLLSALPKLRHPQAFARTVIMYDILPPKISYIFGMILIPLEAFLAIAFFTGFWLSIALPLATILLILFLIAVGLNLRWGRKIACGCFSRADEQISLRTMARLLLLLAVTLLLLAFRNNIDIPSIFTLQTMVIDTSLFAYLLSTVSLALFFILLANWVLSLPELLFLTRYLRWHLPLSGNTESKDTMEVT